MSGHEFLSCAHLFCLVLAGVSAAQQPDPLSAPAVRVLPLRVAPGVFVSAQRSQQGGDEVLIRTKTQSCSVLSPYQPVTAAAAIGNDVVIAGVLPDGSFEYRRLVRQGDVWVLASNGVPTLLAYVAKMAWKEGRLAMLLADGSLMTAACNESESLPHWYDMEYVGMAPAGVRRTPALAGLSVVSDSRIEVYDHPSDVVPFVRASSGDWLLQPSQEFEPMLKVDRPVRIGSAVRFYSNVAGPVFLEEEGVKPWLLISDGALSSGWGAMTGELSGSLHADRRYRLHAVDLCGAWFYPAAISGSAWCSSGVKLEECRVLESGVRPQYGSIAFRTTLELEPQFVAEQVQKVAFVVVSPDAAPPTRVRGGHTWLVPQRALVATKPLQAQRRVYALAVSVPLPESNQCIGTWLHCQLAVLSSTGAVLGATGIRSVPILTNDGGRSAAQEQAARASSVAYWAANGVANATEFFDSVTGH